MEERSANERTRILVVEDEEKLRGTIQEYLRLSGYLTMEAQSGICSIHQCL